MTGSTSGTASSTAISPDARRVWRAARLPVVIVVLLLAAAVLAVLTSSGGSSGELDPESYEPAGARALARLLEDQGVDVDPQATSAENATLLVTRPELSTPESLRSLAADAAAVVLVAPDPVALRAVAPGVAVRGPLGRESRSAGCSLPAARAAESVTIGGLAYEAAQTCYDGAVVREGNVTVVGESAPLTNDHLDEDGNAALAVHLLGQHPRLVWHVPSPGDPTSRVGDQTLYDLLPSGWVFGAVQVGVAVVLLALWRARRLGPVVTEPLPVVVRAAETVEGRARLYRKAGAADHAADALRQASRDRLLPRLGLGPDAEPEAVLTAIANRTGRDARPLLYGRPPRGDDELVALANDLDELEREVGR